MIGIFRSSARVAGPAENFRATPTVWKPLARKSSVTNRPIRPEAPRTRILRETSMVELNRFGDHQPENDHDGAEAGNTEQEPAAKQRKIARRQRLPPSLPGGG